MKNVIWFAQINSIGGVESVIWNVVRLFPDKDITIWYNTADPKQLFRLSKYVKLLKFNPTQHIECDTLIVNYAYDLIEGHVEAKRKIYMVHANYKYLWSRNLASPCTDPQFEYYAVSKWAADMYYEVSGIQPKVCYNPITIDDDREALIIVSATRICRDKGNLVWRMETLANRLTQRNVPFLWLVFTNSEERINNPNVVSIPQRLDILPFLHRANFVAQLSDSEAFCMTALESATLGTPLLITKIPSFSEMGLDDTNSIQFDFDMSNMDECIDRMVGKKFKFKYTPRKDCWEDFLGTETVAVEPKTQVRALMDYTDLMFGITVHSGDQFYVSRERLEQLLAKEVVELVKEEN